MRLLFMMMLLLCIMSKSHGQNGFITTWDLLAGESITIPTNSSYTYNYSVDWGDGATETSLTGDASHTYASAGTYTVEITGTFPAIYFNGGGDRTKIQSVEQWGNIAWQDMTAAFLSCVNLVVNATDAPDLSSVSSLQEMFRNARALDDDLSSWDVSNVTNMSGMFRGAIIFNQSLDAWDVSNVQDMSLMFNDAIAYNAAISSWDVTSVTNMSEMFKGALVFDQDIGDWDVSNVQNMSSMLQSALAFDQNLGGWDIASATNVQSFLNNALDMSVLNYDKLLVGWSQKTLPNGLSFGATDVHYCNSSAERQSIITNFGWTITDAGTDCSDGGFITTWQTTTAGESITIPTNPSYTYNYSVDWGDGNTSTSQTGDASHTYASAGTYTVEIKGSFPAIYFNGGGDRTKLETIEQWGGVVWQDMTSAFQGCTDLNINATDVPHLDFVTSLQTMFRNARDMNYDFSSWDVSSITNMSEMFRGAIIFNQSLNAWDVSNVQDMSLMFNDAIAYDAAISSWDITSLTNMSEMFKGAIVFDQDIGDWDVSNVQNLNGTFFSALAFDQDLSDWNIVSATNVQDFIRNSGMSIANYDKLLFSWSKKALPSSLSFGATNVQYCTAAAERQYIITNFGWTITDAGSECSGLEFISTWSVNAGESITIPTNPAYDYLYSVDWGDGSSSSNQTGDATHTYSSGGTYSIQITGSFPAIYFNNGGDKDKLTDITSWGGIVWQTMENAFYGCSNLDISAINNPVLDYVTSMEGMFRDNISLNGTSSEWDVSNVTNMAYMFENASSFNQNLGSWNISNVTSLNNMLDNSGMFFENYDSTLIGWSTQTLANNCILGASGLGYCNASVEHQSIIDNFNWTIIDEGQGCPFIITWKTTSAGESITIPTNSSYTYNYKVDWGDDTLEANLTGDATHTYAAAGTYTVEITGTFPTIYFNDPDGNTDILSVEQWGDIKWQSMANAFSGCLALQIYATDAPDLSNVTSLTAMFRRTSLSIANGINTWDLSNVTTISYMFLSSSFDTDISDWNVSNVTSMSSTFQNTSFDQDISDWDVSSLQNAVFMFRGGKFNQDISDWDVSQVTNMKRMFFSNTLFDQDISKWNVSKVTKMDEMFDGASSFNQDLSSWDFSKVTSASNMFDGSGLSTTNYDALLISLSKQGLKTGITLGASGIEFCVSDIERQKTIDDFGWTINDAGIDASCFTTTSWNGSSWSAGTPTTGVLAILDADYDTYIDGELNADDFAVKPTYTLTVRGDSAAMLDGDLINLGTILVQDTSSLIQTATSPSNSGSGTYSVQKEAVSHFTQYNYWSSPVQQTNFHMVFDDAFAYTFDASSQSWTRLKETTDNFTIGEGFTVSGTNTGSTSVTRTFSGANGFNSGTITITPYFDGIASDPDENWNLIGNPYPSGLDVAQFLTDNNSVLENAVYLWSSDGDDSDGTDAEYATMNALGGVNAGGSGIDPSSATISSCQGFFVQTLATGNINFNNSQRVATNNTFQRTTSSGQRMWLSVSMENGASNELLLGFMDDGALGKDQYDAAKLSGNHHLSFYSMMETSKPLAIQGLPELSGDMEIPLGVEAKSSGTFTFQISKLDNFSEETAIYLFDALTEKLIDLKADSYTVELNEGVYEGRFSLRLIANRVTSLEDSSIDMGIWVYPKNQQINIEFKDLQAAQAEVTIYDLMGKVLVKHRNEEGLVNTFEVPQPGIWIVQVVNQQGRLSKKILIVR